MVQRLSPLAQHLQKWKDCELCDLWKTRNKIVIMRGRVPCDVLFVGEAPGDSEDVLGSPFKGPAGHLLDKVIAKAMDYDEGGSAKWSCAFTNLVCCIPKLDGEKGEPDVEHIQACQGRLEEFILLARPRLLVAVGKLAEEYLAQGYKHSVKIPKELGASLVKIDHPAYILRQNIAQRGLTFQRCVVTLSNAFEDYLDATPA